MHNRYRARAALAATLAILIVSTACSHAVVTNPTTTPQTALQWTVVYNAAVAKTNRAVEQAVETVHSTGAITADQARPIIVICGRVAAASEAIRGITSAGTEATWNTDAPKIRGIVDQLGPDLLAKAGLNNQTVDLAVAALSAALTLLRGNLL